MVASRAGSRGDLRASSRPRDVVQIGEAGPHPDLGNLLFLVGEGDQARILKLYRRRRSFRRELLGGFSHWLWEGKRGVTAEARCETERLSLGLWASHGFDVFRLYDEELPSWIGGRPALWLEYAPGERLFDVLMAQATPPEEKERLVVRLASENRRRHARALELSEPLLIHEHSTTKHSLVSGDRLITIDLEGGYLPGYPVLAAIGQELVGTLRSLWSGREPCFAERLPRLFIEGYGEAGLLRRAAGVLLSGGLRWRFKRMSDRRRRSARSKTAVAEQLLEFLGPSP